MNTSTPGLRVACIGEAMVELTLGRDASSPVGMGFAGDTLNTAIYLKRLLGDTSLVAYTSVLGSDPLSERMIDYLELESIDTRTISRSADRLVGLYAITTDQNGERTFSYWRNESAARTLFQLNGDLDFSALLGFDVLMLSAISLAILPNHVRQALISELARLRSRHGTTIVFDSNFRPRLWESVEIAQQTVADAWRITDIALPSIDDEMALFEDTDEAAVIARLNSYGVNRGALKRGERGPLSLNRFEQKAAPNQVGIDATPVTVVDTTAAGDSFNAGYLSAVLTGSSELEALSAGHGCATRVIAHRGAIIPRNDW